jgi:hypothetical protein
MTRLVNPGLGEKIDRVIILRLKLRHYDKLLHGPLLLEEKALNDAIGFTALTKQQKSDAWELREVHKLLWAAEDTMRRYRDRRQQLSNSTLLEVAQVGMEIQQLNDRRAGLVRVINLSDGDEYQEKGTGEPPLDSPVEAVVREASEKLRAARPRTYEEGRRDGLREARATVQNITVYPIGDDHPKCGLHKGAAFVNGQLEMQQSVLDALATQAPTG